MENIFSPDDISKWDNLLRNASRVILATHAHPDGDAIGSVTGLASYLKDRNINTSIICPNAYPAFLNFLDKEGEIVIYQGNEEFATRLIDCADLLIAMDVCGFSRLDELGELLVNKPVHKILIDHHPGPCTEEFDLVFSLTQVSSTCELTSSLLTRWHPDVDFSAAQATSFLAGMYTDTNQFANSLFSDTFTVASELFRMGADNRLIMEKVYGSYTYNRMRLMGYALQKMKLIPRYKAAYIVLTAAELSQFEFQEGDTEGFANLPLAIDGVSIAGLFLEKEHYVKVSLRSRGPYPVNGIAKDVYQGGGHYNAAAGRIKKPVAEMDALFENALGTIIA